MSLYYRFILKNSDNQTPSGVSVDSYIDNYGNSSQINLPTPLSSSIDIYYITSSASPYYNICSSENARKINALTNTINYYRANSKYFDSSYYQNKTVTLINIPSAIYDSSINKGSVSLKFYYTGSLIGELRDYKKNGELIEVTGSNVGGTAGIVLYNEGFILLTASWALNNSVTDGYVYCDAASLNETDNPRWIHWGRGLDSSSINYSSFDIDFEGTTKIHTLTMLAHAPKSELNFSPNPTFVKKANVSASVVTNANFKEYEYKEIKNTVKTDYVNVTGTYQPQVFINKIGIYDSDKKLIAIAKVSTPVKKTENRAITFKLKLDT